MKPHTAENVTQVNGHRVVYRHHRFVCLTCEVRLLNMMTFNTRECPGARVTPPEVGAS